MFDQRCYANSSSPFREGRLPTGPAAAPPRAWAEQRPPVVAAEVEWQTAVWLAVLIAYAVTKFLVFLVLLVVGAPLLVFLLLLLVAVELENVEMAKLAGRAGRALSRIHLLRSPAHLPMNDFDQRPATIIRLDIRRSYRPEMDTGSVPSPRRRRDITPNGVSNWKRTSSLNSSNSSDILVAGPQSHTTPPHADKQDSFPAAAVWSNAPSMASSTRASVVNGRLTIRFTSDAAKQTLRNIDKVQPRPLSLTPRTTSTYHNDAEEYRDSQDGPNHRGTYSKQYTMEHPEIKFVHRGQGRYVRVSDVKVDIPTTSPRSTRQAAPAGTTVEASATNEVLEEMYEILVQCFDAHRRKVNPACKENWSPIQKSQFTALWTLIKQTPRNQWSTLSTPYSDVVWKFTQNVDHRFPHEGASDSRSRLTRQAKTTAYVEQRRSTRPRASANNIFDSEEELDEESDERQDSDIDDQAPPKLDPNSTVHADDLHLYPGQAFHHTGNRFYRPGIGPHGAHGSIAITQNGTKRKYSDYIEEEKAAREEDEMSETADAGGTFSKEYVQRHPEIDFVHRGKGRYRRRSEIGTSSATPAASSERRSSRVDNSFAKDYAESHVSDEYMRSSRAKRNSRANIALDDAGDVLYDKKYVDSHPNELFHHRGQGRYARGPRNIRAPAPKEEAPLPVPVPEPALEELVSSSFVDAHPNETFHHRGQGKWARGLPPPGSSNKTAVRGPGRDGAVDDEMDADGNRLPGLTALVVRSEGPDKWPNLRWVYRGGGKWCRQTKEEIQKAAMPPAAPRRPRTSVYARARNSDAEAQLQRENLAAEGSIGGGHWRGKENIDAQASTRSPKVVRRRGQRSGHPNGESKGSSNSQSKAPTPRPALLSPEEDILTEVDFPTLYKDDWTLEDLGGNTDQASRIQQRMYRSIVGPEHYVTALTKHDPAVRSLANLKLIAANAQKALMALQTEYLELDKIVAINPMGGKKERKPVKGGRQTVEPAVFEDRKEALLYDYTFDPRKIGYQDPDAQRIVRDDEGRELRRRRNRVGADNSLPNGVNYGDGEMTAKRTVKPVSRFDGNIIQAPRKRSRLSNAPGSVMGETATPPLSRPETPVAAEVETKRSGRQQRGRQPEHVPKRIRELRHESVPSARSASEESSSRVGASIAEAATLANNDNATGGGMSMSAILNPAPGPDTNNNPFTNPLMSTSYLNPDHDMLDIRHLSPLPPLSPTGGGGGPGSVASSIQSSLSSSVRKGRPPGSKNLHKRKDAGIKKGPRKPKMAVGGEESNGGSVEPEGEGGVEDDGDGDVVMGGGESPTPMMMMVGSGNMERML